MQFSASHDVTLALDGGGGGWSTRTPAALILGRDPVLNVHRLGGRQDRSERVWIKGNALRPQGFEPRTSYNSTDICISHIKVLGYKAVALQISDALKHKLFLCVLSIITNAKTKLTLYTPWRAPHTHWIGGRVGLKAGPGVLENR
jgi:hypothetical protein